MLQEVKSSAGNTPYVGIRKQDQTFTLVLYVAPLLQDITFSINYKDGTVPPLSVISTAPDLAPAGYAAGSKTGEYVVYADTKPGWYVDYWEAAKGKDAADGFQKVEDSDGKNAIAVMPGADTTYRAVVKAYDWADAGVKVTTVYGDKSSFHISCSDTDYRQETDSEDGSAALPLANCFAEEYIKQTWRGLSIFLSQVTQREQLLGYMVNINGNKLIRPDEVIQTPEVKFIARSSSFSVDIQKDRYEYAKSLSGEDAIDIKIIYQNPNPPAYTVTATVNDEAMGTVSPAYDVGGGEYQMIAEGKDGCAVAYWEVAEGKDATTGFKTVAGSEGKDWLQITADKDMTYRAVFVDAVGKVDFLEDEAGIRNMQYNWAPKYGVSWGNCPDELKPTVPTSSSTNILFTADGSVKAENITRLDAKPAAVTAGNGAELWFTFRYYADLQDITVKAYAGDTVAEDKLLYTLSEVSLAIDNSNNGLQKGTGVCYIPVAGMPDIDKVTIVFTANGVTTQKTLGLKAAMKPSNIGADKIAATKEVINRYNTLAEEIQNGSITYEYSSQYLMLKEELAYGLKEIAAAETADALSAARQKALTWLEDTANGLYHHGVDACISVNGTMRVVRVPQLECVFTAMTAALEQAYPNGHWYYTVGIGSFGIFFGHAGYVADPTKHSHGVDYNSSFASATYGVSDYFGRKMNGSTNGLSIQCVWNGISTNTPTHFDATDAPENAITINPSSTTRILAWDMARLRQYYSDEELLGNAVYAEALDELTAQSGEADALDKMLRIEYVDFFLCDETQATRKVVKAIGALSEQSDQADVNAARTAYNALSDEEKRGVFNYSDLLPLLQLKEDERTALEIDLKINNIGTVEYTNEILAKIKEARNAYDNANADAQALVTKLDTLTSAEKAFAALVEEKKAEFVDAVGKLPSTIVYPDSKAAIDAAQSVWKSLLKDEQNALSAEKAILDKAQAEYENAKAEYYSSRLDGALERVLKYIDKTVTNPQVGSVGGEWAVLAQARAGIEKDEYYDSYYKTVAEYVASIGSNKLDERKSTENSRVILALSSIGKNATNVGGYDLTAPYADFSWVKKQGLNGVIFALLALDSGNYEIPENSSVSNQTTREKLIDEILNAELENGGWSYSGDDADPDMTAMALQALAPYHEQKEVADAINRALIVLQSLQNSDGSFGSDSANSGANVESTSQVIIALLTLGINPVEDDRFIKGNANPFTAILAYQLDNGGFEHEIGSGIDQMATEQAAMALTAYQRFLNSESALYVMTDREQVVDPFVPDEKDDENNNSPSDTNKSDLTTAADISTTENTDDKNNGSKKSPMTGNESYDISYLGMILTPYTVLAVIAFKRRKDNFKNSV